MQMIFLNSLEKKVENSVVTAQITICDQEGEWQILWNEPDKRGKMKQSKWYQGSDWNELLHQFQEGVLQKAGQGFIPVLDSMPGDIRPSSGQRRMNYMLQYYGESHYNKEIYEELREWRRKTAAAESKSLFIVSTNRVLQMLSAYLPHTIDELKQIPGFGKQRLEAYGESILVLLRKHERSTRFPLLWVKDEVHERDFQMWLRTQQLQKMEQDREREKKRRELLEGIEEGSELTDLQQHLSLTKREVITYIEQLERDGYDVAPIVDKELESVSSQEQDQARKAFAETGDRFLKPVVAILYADKEMESEEKEAVYGWLRLLRIKYRQEQETVKAG